MKGRGKSTWSEAVRAQLAYFKLISSLCWQEFSRRDQFQYVLSAASLHVIDDVISRPGNNLLPKCEVWAGQMIIWTFPIAPAGNKSSYSSVSCLRKEQSASICRETCKQGNDVCLIVFTVPQKRRWHGSQAQGGESTAGPFAVLRQGNMQHNSLSKFWSNVIIVTGTAVPCLISTIMVRLILSIEGKGEKGTQRSRGSSSCWISYEGLIKLSLYERNWNSSLHGLCQWGCDSCHCYWASWYWIRAWAVFFLTVFRTSAVLPHLGGCKFIHLPLLWTWIDIRKNTRTEQVFCPRRLNDSRWSEW